MKLYVRIAYMLLCVFCFLSGCKSDNTAMKDSCNFANGDLPFIRVLQIGDTDASSVLRLDSIYTTGEYVDETRIGDEKEIIIYGESIAVQYVNSHLFEITPAHFYVSKDQRVSVVYFAETEAVAQITVNGAAFPEIAAYSNETEFQVCAKKLIADFCGKTDLEEYRYSVNTLTLGKAKNEVYNYFYLPSSEEERVGSRWANFTRYIGDVSTADRYQVVFSEPLKQFYVRFSPHDFSQIQKIEAEPASIRAALENYLQNEYKKQGYSVVSLNVREAYYTVAKGEPCFYCGVDVKYYPTERAPEYAVSEALGLLVFS